MSKNRILIASAVLALLPVFAWAAGAIPDLNTQIRQKGLGKEYFLGHNVPQSSSQASFVAAVAEEHAAGGGTVHVVADTPISSAVTVPSDVKVIVESGAKFLKQTGGSLTFEGPVEVTDSSAFYGFVGAGVDGGASDLVFSTASRAQSPQGLYIRPAAALGTTPELRIEGNSSELFTADWYFDVLAHGVNNLPDGRRVFGVMRTGGVYVWDYMTIGGSGPPAGFTSFMLGVASDLGPAGVSFSVLNNNQHHDLAYFVDAGPTGTYENGNPRLIIKGNGLVSFGPATAAAPALKPNSAELQVRKGDDSGLADLRVENLTAGNNIVATGGFNSLSNTVYSSNIYANSGTLRLDGVPTDGSSAVAVRSNAGYVLTVAGSKLFSFQNNQVEMANVDRRGMVQLGVGNASACDTCASGIRGQICYVGGAAGVKDTVQVCAKDASNAYAWRTIY